MHEVSKIVSDALKAAETAQISQISPENMTPAELLERARVRPTETIEADPVAIWMQSDERNIPFGTLGNFSMITGKAKTKKSFTLCLAVAPAVYGSHFNSGPFISALPPEKPRIVYFDTEQGRHRVWKSVKRVCRMAGIDDPPSLEYYDLRGFETGQRVSMIDWYLKDGNPEKDIGLVIVDGCRDLVHDFNDPKEATALATHLMQWTADAQCHLITVLHQNKGDTNARGHVGTELTNKAETVITVELDGKDKKVSVVEARECREEGFNGFAFMVNESGLPEVLANYEIGSKGPGVKKQFDVHSYPPETHKKVIETIFSNGPINGRDQYIQQTRSGWGTMIPTPGESAAKLAMAYWEQMGWVKNIASKGSKAIYQQSKSY